MMSKTGLNQVARHIRQLERIHQGLSNLTSLPMNTEQYEDVTMAGRWIDSAIKTLGMVEKDQKFAQRTAESGAK